MREQPWPESGAREVLRVPSPAPAPQALAFEAGILWMGSWETQRIYGMKPDTFVVFEEANAPGRPVGMTAVGDELRVVCSEADDSRFIRRYIPGHGFVLSDRVACPDDTGSFLAFDNVHVWLSQRYNERVLELDAQYRPIAELHVGAQILGLVWAAGRLYVSTWHGKNGGCRVGRIDARSEAVEYVASLPFAAVSLAHDGTAFFTNDARASQIVAFTLPKDRLV
jgi:hypothetical protein